MRWGEKSKCGRNRGSTGNGCKELWGRNVWPSRPRLCGLQEAQARAPVPHGSLVRGGCTDAAYQRDGETADRGQHSDWRGDPVGQTHVGPIMADGGHDEQNKTQEGDGQEEADHARGKTDGGAEKKSTHGSFKRLRCSPTLQ